MNLEGQTVKNKQMRLEVADLEVGADEEAKTYHERELRFIAAFRLRDAANRVATLVSMSTSAQLRAELLAVYERLMDEERELLVRSMDAANPKLNRPASGRAGNHRRSQA